MEQKKIDYDELLRTQTTTSSNGSILNEENIKKAWNKSLAKWLIDLLFKDKR
jgi:hypothetical protein